MLHLLKSLEHLFRTRANGNVVSEVHPSDDAIGIEEKFRRSRDVRLFRSRSGVQYIVSTNDLRFRIRKQWKGAPEFLRVPLVSLW